MNISRFLTKECIQIGLSGETKEEILTEMVEFACNVTDVVRNEKKLLRAIIDRERKASTGIGMGIAIPHGRTHAVRDFMMVLAIDTEGKDFDTLDNEPAHLFFLMSAPPDNDTKYLRVIRELSESLRDENLRQELIDCDNVDKAYYILKRSG